MTKILAGVVPIIPDEARTFGMDALFRELEIYASQGQKYEPVDHDLLLSYSEDSDGQILEEGITEAGSLASFIAAGSSYATGGVPMIPFYTFYSMFGFQRVGDLIWQAADARVGDFSWKRPLAAPHCSERGYNIKTGTALCWPRRCPQCRPMTLRLRSNLEPSSKTVSIVCTAQIPPKLSVMSSTTSPCTTRITQCPRSPTTLKLQESLSVAIRGLYRWRPAPQGKTHSATIIFSGISHQAATIAANEFADHYDVGAELWSATSYKRLREQALEVERSNRLHPSTPQEEPLVTQLLNGH